MMVLAHLLHGCVLFGTKGKNPEKLLNRVTAAGIPIWDIRTENETVFACTTPDGYRKLRSCVQKSGFRLRIKRRFGLPFLWKRFRRRWGVCCGLVLFFGMLILLSGSIWNVTVSGASESVCRTVKQTVEQLGVGTGSRKNSLQMHTLKEELLRELPNLAWAAVNLNGCELNIEVRERSLPPEIVAEDRPCNLKARIGGVVLQIRATAGFPTVSIGDTVAPGDLLVSGVRTDAFGATMLRHAQGEIIAATTHTVRCEIPLHQTEWEATGVTVERKRLILFGIELPLNLTSPPQGEQYVRRVKNEIVNWFGVPLPIRYCTEIWEEQQAKERILTQREAEALAKKELKKIIKHDYPSVTVRSSEETVELRNKILTLTAVLQCEENIATEEEIYREEE